MWTEKERTQGTNTAKWNTAVWWWTHHLNRERSFKILIVERWKWLKHVSADPWSHWPEVESRTKKIKKRGELITQKGFPRLALGIWISVGPANTHCARSWEWWISGWWEAWCTFSSIYILLFYVLVFWALVQISFAAILSSKHNSGLHVFICFSPFTFPRRLVIRFKEFRFNASSYKTTL